MKYKAIYGIALIFASFGIFSMMIFHHTNKTYAKSDDISGDWDALAEAFGTQTALRVTLKLDGDKVTGTIESGHTGAGTISEGSWKNNHLSFTANFTKHESISFKADLKDGKLTGEYATEGRVGSWEAVRKNAAVKTDEPPTTPNAAVKDALAGEWEALLSSGETTVPLVLKFRTDGDKVTGTFESEHLGTGTIEAGRWTDNKLGFTLKTTVADITFNGVLKDGKLSGDFSTGKMNGKWEAHRK